MNSFLEVRGIVARQGRFRLEIDTAFPDGWTALFGPSGAGKTTLLEIIAGLRRPDAGRVIMAGRTLFDAAAKENVPPQRRGIGYVPQDLALFPHLSVRISTTDVRRATTRRSWPTCWSGWKSARCWRKNRTRFPEVRSSAWRSRGRCWHGPRCSCSTSR
jgi:ABC-type sugar transport system ATPase subunit